MKRKIAFIMTLVMALLCCASGPAGAAGSTPVFVWQDCAVQLLKYEVFESKYSEGSVALYARVMNNKDYALNIAIEDGEMDGKKLFITSIYNVAPHTDTGTKDPQYFHIYVKSGENAETNFFASARKLTASLQFINQETKEILSSQEFSLDLDVLDRIIPTPAPTNTPAPTPVPTSTPTPAPAPDDNDYGNNPPPYSPASWNFTGLKEGSSGQAVRDVQQRLWDLGYYRDAVNGEYGTTTTIAVRSFCDQNGLPVGNNVTPEMQSLLYSSDAQYYEPPYLPLVIGPHAKWDNAEYGTDVGFLYPQVVNRGDRDIRGFELYYYLENVWGDTLYVLTDKGNKAYLNPRTITQTIKGGYYEYLETAKGLPITPFAATYTVYVGVHKIVFADGEIREIPVDEIEYYSIQIKN